MYTKQKRTEPSAWAAPTEKTAAATAANASISKWETAGLMVGCFLRETGRAAPNTVSAGGVAYDRCCMADAERLDVLFAVIRRKFPETLDPAGGSLLPGKGGGRGPGSA